MLVSLDSDFCSHCGTILPVPQSAPCTLQCLVCKNERTIKESTRLVNKVEFNLERQVIQWDDQDEHMATVDHTCTKCGHLVATYTTQQTRSADEGQTVFYTCLKCKHRDIEYS